MSTKTEDINSLLPSNLPTNVSSAKLNRKIGLIALTLCAIFVLHNLVRIQGIWQSCGSDLDVAVDVCPQTHELVPQKNFELWKHVGETFGTESFKDRAVEWLGAAVRVPTESYDQMDDVGVDPRWEIFGLFHDYLSDAFPLIHATLSITKVNTYGLVYVWPGSDISLKPILLTAHQDVVPVDPTTVDQWVHPPYSGHFDGKRIWGRGSMDDKSGLIGIMSSIEALLESNFKPTRGIVLAFGFDEETSGFHGAYHLAQYLLSTFGQDGFALLLDEGAGIISDRFGGVVALPGITEKGYFDVRIEVTSPGGHSSLPPPHTSIGILSALLVKYETNPYETHLARSSPFYQIVQCQGAHAPSMPSSLRKIIRNSVHSDKALHKLENLLFQDPMLKSLVGTTQAIDLIQGGVKANALPERAWAVVNHRIATESSVGAVQAHDMELLKGLAAQFNLTYKAFGVLVSDEGAPSYGTLTLSDAWNAALEPAPVTPTGQDSDAAPYRLLSGTIKAVYNAHRSLSGDQIYVSPAIMSGNTDTRYYWSLTKNIFRYSHYDSGNDPLVGGVHTVNENVNAESFIEMIRFFATLILNTDESVDL